MRDAPDLTADRAGRARRQRQRDRAALGLARGAARAGPVRHASSASTPHRRWTSSTGRSLAVTTIGTGRVTSYRVDLQLDRDGAGRRRGRAAARRRPPVLHPLAHRRARPSRWCVETRLRIGGAAPVPALGPVRLNAAAHSRPDEAAGVGRAGGGRADHRRDRVRGRAARPADAHRRPPRRRAVGRGQHRRRPGVRRRPARAGRDPARQRERDRAGARARAATHGRPTLEIPPPLAAVPQLRTPGAGRRAGALPARPDAVPPGRGARRRGAVRTERVAAGALLAACRATPDGRVLGRPVEPLARRRRRGRDPGPEPRRPGRARRRPPVGGRSTRVDDRFLVYLAGHHPYRDRLFVAGSRRSSATRAVRRDAAAGRRALGLPGPRCRRSAAMSRPVRRRRASSCAFRRWRRRRPPCGARAAGRRSAGLLRVRVAGRRRRYAPAASSTRRRSAPEPVDGAEVMPGAEPARPAARRRSLAPRSRRRPARADRHRRSTTRRSSSAPTAPATIALTVPGGPGDADPGLAGHPHRTTASRRRSPAPTRSSCRCRCSRMATFVPFAPGAGVRRRARPHRRPARPAPDSGDPSSGPASPGTRAPRWCCCRSRADGAGRSRCRAGHRHVPRVELGTALPGLPGVTTLLEVSPLPFGIRRRAAAAAGTAHLLPGAGQRDPVARDDELVARRRAQSLDRGHRAFVGLLFGDRVALSPAAWVELIADGHGRASTPRGGRRRLARPRPVRRDRPGAARARPRRAAGSVVPAAGRRRDRHDGRRRRAAAAGRRGAVPLDRGRPGGPALARCTRCTSAASAATADRAIEHPARRSAARSPPALTCGRPAAARRRPLVRSPAGRARRPPGPCSTPTAGCEPLVDGIDVLRG